LDYTGTCKGDGKAPQYQKLNPSDWFYDNLEACCDRYYPHSKKSQCMNEKGSGLWFVDYKNNKCTLDCVESNGPRCGGLADGEDLFLDPMSCCNAKLSWIYPEFCEVSFYFKTIFC